MTSWEACGYIAGRHVAIYVAGRHVASWGGMWLAGRHVASWEACG